MELSSASAFTYTATEVGAVGGVNYSHPVLARATSRPTYAPQIALVGDLLKDFRLVQPLVVNLEKGDNGKIMASDDVFYMYGEGYTRQEAVRDYLSSLSEYYTLLESHDDAPSVELFSYLQTYLYPISSTT